MSLAWTGPNRTGPGPGPGLQLSQCIGMCMQVQLPEIKQLGKKLENSRLDLESLRSSFNSARDKYLALQQQASDVGEPSEPSPPTAGVKLSPLQQAREQMESTRTKADEQEQRLLEIKARLVLDNLF